MDKQMLLPDEMITHLIENGVKFDIINEQEAIHYLQEHTNYFKLTAYRKNYPKHPDGINKGKYIDLDFAYLKELSIMDMRLRYTLLEMCLDLEHYLKIHVISQVEQWDRSKAYSIVDEFIGSQTMEVQERMRTNMITSSAYDVYRKGLKDYYEGHMPIWAFAEIISFGELARLTCYVKQRTVLNDSESVKAKEVKVISRLRNMLSSVNSLRNACAHNSCILNDLSRGNDSPTVQIEVRQMLYNNQLKASYVQSRLRSVRIGQIVTLLYLYDEFVTSENVKENRLGEFRKIICERFNDHKDYFTGNILVSDTINFLQNVVDSCCKK